MSSEIIVFVLSFDNCPKLFLIHVYQHNYFSSLPLQSPRIPRILLSSQPSLLTLGDRVLRKYNHHGKWNLQSTLYAIVLFHMIRYDIFFLLTLTMWYLHLLISNCHTGRWLRIVFSVNYLPVYQLINILFYQLFGSTHAWGLKR